MADDRACGPPELLAYVRDTSANEDESAVLDVRVEDGASCSVIGVGGGVGELLALAVRSCPAGASGGGVELSVLTIDGSGG